MFGRGDRNVPQKGKIKRILWGSSFSNSAHRVMLDFTDGTSYILKVGDVVDSIIDGSIYEAVGRAVLHLEKAESAKPAYGAIWPHMINDELIWKMRTRMWGWIVCDGTRGTPKIHPKGKFSE